VKIPREIGVVSLFKGTLARLASTPRRPFTVLIVDDEAPVRQFVERVVQKAGHATTTAESGAAALEAALKLESIDLLITDLMMPQMNGDELARRLLTVRPSLKVLYLTGFSDQLFKEKVALWHDEAFLEKPCSVKGLMEAVSLLLLGRFETLQPSR
jgi:CheY-like chemotaxis protein